MTDDRSIHHDIDALVEEEHALRSALAEGRITSAEEQRRLGDLEVELDRLWDLLRQRAARRNAGQSTGLAHERSGRTVENYLD
ncbi:DUF2630 family protein [Kocuria sp.]|uniref:DUF2630 family protein n=1 Tax=Kocuria sp. TaxID=1871328 RepID=UPI0026DC7077|nr:DUF2630 family protein [Kocuria sp.]MDO4920017.1 DUF2630 family protein [Kocuria sp.]